MHLTRLSPFLVAALAACGPRPAGSACGISALAGPVMILDQFSVPGQTLSRPPGSLPEGLAVRVAAGPVVRGLVGRVDSLMIVGVDQPLPAAPVPGFGVLITDLEGQVRGVILFEGAPLAGAPLLGTVQAGERSIPLLGLRVDPSRVEDARCPMFPDSASTR